MSGVHSGEIKCLAKLMLYDATPNDSTIKYCIFNTMVRRVCARQTTRLNAHVTTFCFLFNTDHHDKLKQHWSAIYASRSLVVRSRSGRVQ